MDAVVCKYLFVVLIYVGEVLFFCLFYWKSLILFQIYYWPETDRIGDYFCFILNTNWLIMCPTKDSVGIWCAVDKMRTNVARDKDRKSMFVMEKFECDVGAGNED